MCLVVIELICEIFIRILNKIVNEMCTIENHNRIKKKKLKVEKKVAHVCARITYSSSESSTYHIQN